MVNAEQYAKAKELFFELMSKPADDQAKRLREVEASAPEIANEVRLLLEKISSKTILESTQRSRAESVTSKNRVSSHLNRVRYWLVGGFVPISIAFLSLVVICCLGLFLRSEINQNAREKYQIGLKSAIDGKKSQILRWSEYNQLRIADWGKQPILQRCVSELDQICRTTVPVDLRDRLRVAPQQRLTNSSISKAFNKSSRIGRTDFSSVHKPSAVTDMKYAIWNSNFQLLADWQFETNDQIGFGEMASMTVKSILSRVFEEGLPQIVLPDPGNETVSMSYSVEAEEPYVMFFVPIFAPSNIVDVDPKSSAVVIGAMMVRSTSFMSELREYLTEALVPDGQCYMIDANGHFTSDVEDQDRLRLLPEMEELREKNGKILLHCLDPGIDLLNSNNQKPEGPETWTFTLAARRIMLGKDGENIQGYRDYRGVLVIGAWSWVEELGRGIIIEVPYTDAFRGIEFVTWVFLLLLALPLSFVASLLGISLFRNLRDIDFSNRSLGSYRLSKKLGEGGLGVVYLGVHKTLHRPAAIKLVKPNVVTPATIKRFEREVRLAASFDHPHAVHIYDFGVSKDGHVYCVMQLVEGITLAQLMQFTGGIPIARTIHILNQVAETLAEAHQFGLVHRDVKPQNVMVSSIHPRDHVKVVDFGLAKHIADPIRRDLSATRVVIGTPGFIAPERIDSPWITDPRIDTFSFGVLGLFLLTGKVPSLTKTYQAIKESIQNRSDASSLNSDVLHELINVLLLCCNSDPEKRPTTMNAVSTTLSLLARNMPWHQDEADQWWETNENTLEEWKESDQARAESR
jgi:hypothetical protein